MIRSKAGNSDAATRGSPSGISVGRVVGVILLLLAAGFLVNVGVAWSVVAQTQYLDFDPAATARARREQWNRPDADREIWIDRIWLTRGMELRFLHKESDPGDWTVVHETGWPYHGIRGRSRAQPNGTWRASGAIDMKTDLEMMLFVDPNAPPVARDTTPKVLPLMPMWPGALLNTLIFAGMLAALAMLVLAVRTTVRLARGGCPFCAYDLRRQFAGGCPECGWRRTRD